MKKIVLVSLTLLITGTMFADKKCCKGKASCSKDAAKTETKACCKKGEASTKSPWHKEDAATTETATAGAGEMHACCKKSIANGGKACCAKKTTENQPKAEPTTK